MLGSRYERTEKMEDLEEAIKRAQEAVAATPDDHPNQAPMLNNLGNMLGLRFDRTGKMENLEQAIQRSCRRRRISSKKERAPSKIYLYGYEVLRTIYAQQRQVACLNHKAIIWCPYLSLYVRVVIQRHREIALQVLG